MEDYKKILLNAGIDVNDNDIKDIQEIIDIANACGCSIDIYDIVKILVPPQQINIPRAIKTLSQVAEELKK